MQQFLLVPQSFTEYAIKHGQMSLSTSSTSFSTFYQQFYATVLQLSHLTKTFFIKMMSMNFYATEKIIRRITSYNL